jgi:hypothetical protein
VNCDALIIAISGDNAGGRVPHWGTLLDLMLRAEDDIPRLGII